MAHGTIKKKSSRGFGYIRTSRGNDLYFDTAAVADTTFDQLREGQRVSYDEGKGLRGPRAENVKPL